MWLKTTKCARPDPLPLTSGVKMLRLHNPVVLAEVTVLTVGPRSLVVTPVVSVAPRYLPFRTRRVVKNRSARKRFRGREQILPTLPSPVFPMFNRPRVTQTDRLLMTKKRHPPTRLQPLPTVFAEEPLTGMMLQLTVLPRSVKKMLLNPGQP